MSAAQVELRAVSKSFLEGERERTVFRDLSVSIKPGEWVFLLGRSGSGKSTLLNLISGIDLPDRGEILIDNRNLVPLSERERTLFRRDSIGLVFQFYNLIPTLTVAENILLPLELSGKLTPEPRDRALELLELVGLADRAKSYPDRLSGGEQQRIAVARALAHAPRLLLADEPTGNLDTETGRQVLDLFQRLVRRAEATLLLVTHSAEVARLADRILTIKDGKLLPLEGGRGGAT